jgi:hypothetical protein
VTAVRTEWAQHLRYVIWVETPRVERLRRSIERDGPPALGDSERWMADEDANYRHDPTYERADIVIDRQAPAW